MRLEKIKNFAKYVDQPLVVNKIYEAAPIVVTACAAGLGGHDVFIKKHNDNTSKKSRFLKNAVVLGVVSTASLIASRGLKIGNKKIFGGLIDLDNKENIIRKQTLAVEKFLTSAKPVEEKFVKFLEKAKNKPLSVKEAGYVLGKLNEHNDAVEANSLKGTLFGIKKDLTSKEIFAEIGKLSLLGFIPVAAGVAAGMALDKSENKKANNSNRIKEGFYQYFANIFLCNVGAGAALFGLETLRRKNLVKSITPTKKLAAMTAGIVSTGIIGGSFIANYMSKKIVDPVLLHKKEKNLTFSKIYDERKPEGMDIAMHSDDLATAGVLSGLKWIEPVLPAFYMVSGYRAGMGYRNNHNHRQNENQ